MSKRIKGITIELDGDTRGLDKALGDVNKRSQDVNKELRDVDRLLKFNPGNTELIAQKQKLLGDQVNNTREKLNKLKDAEKEVQRQFENGEIGEEQYRAFQREVVETESKLKHYESQLESTQEKTKSFADRVEESGEKVKKAGESTQTAGKNMTKWVTGPIVAGAAGLVGLATASGQAADRILDLSSITGLSTDSIQEWQHVAKIAGVEGETMTKAVEGLVKKIPQLKKEGGPATEALETMNLTFADLEKMSPDEQIDTITKSLAGMEDEQDRNAAASQLFGGAWKDIAPILDMGTGAIEEAKQEAHDLGRVMSKDSLNDANEFRIEMDKLIGMIQGFALQIGADLAPMLRDTLGPIIQDTIIPALQTFGEHIRNVLDWFKNLSPEMQNLILIIIGIVAAIGPFLVILGTVMKVIGTLMTMVKAVGAVFALLTGPVGIVIAIIAALIAIIVLVVKNWETIKKKTKEVWDFIKRFLKSTWDSIKKTIESVWNGIKNFFTSSWDAIKSIFTSVLSSVVNFVLTRFNNIKSNISNAINEAKTIISNVLNTIKSTFSNILSNVVNGVKSRFTAVKNAVKKGIEAALNIVKGLGKSFLNAGKGLIDQVVKGITGAIGKVKEAVGNVASTIRNFLPFSPAKVGPLSDLDKLDFQGPITDSISKGMPRVEASMKDMLQMPTIEGGLSSSANNASIPQDVQVNLSDVQAVMKIAGHEVKGLIQFITSQQADTKNRALRQIKGRVT
ncbi:hypothetical protein [Halalkalibacter sp. APA_J-10(15)]|uniref:hypothetical protein n=1 Tax=Halalkalibacter sp. APA_J-10(15) TaxID=2933805 RepID=UPI001FF2EE52|nr:hypothetical protein [Halalkalibacter sp. APA_J-10(15)]MCK0471391.1 hypothetical protein [Halalkalibacter sp. APA_J-10(15)]